MLFKVALSFVEVFKLSKTKLVALIYRFREPEVFNGYVKYNSYKELLKLNCPE
jgi:hypothetical protein